MPESLRDMVRRLADDLSSAVDPALSMPHDREESRRLIYEARKLLMEPVKSCEEGQAVLRLKEHGLNLECFNGRFGIWHDHPYGPTVFEEINPVEEVRRFGLEGVQ